MRVRGKLSVVAPERVASVLGAAIRSVRGRVGWHVGAGTCLAIICAHFPAVWGMPARPKTVSQRVRERDGGMCTVPGCSRPATDSHHVEYRSRGGDVLDPANQTAVCEFHHHACIHAEYLHAEGSAPEGLTWMLGGEAFTGGVG